MIDPATLHEGMTVKDKEGRRLGWLVHVGDTFFELGQGSPARRDYMVHFHHVARVAADEVFLDTTEVPLPSE